MTGVGSSRDIAASHRRLAVVTEEESLKKIVAQTKDRLGHSWVGVSVARPYYWISQLSKAASTKVQGLSGLIKGSLLPST